LNCFVFVGAFSYLLGNKLLSVDLGQILSFSNFFFLLLWVSVGIVIVVVVVVGQPSLPQKIQIYGYKFDLQKVMTQPEGVFEIHYLSERNCGTSLSEAGQ
jgi:hypothetical protein